MSAKYPGGIITKNYVAPTPSSAPGIWTLDQQEQAQQAGIWPFGGPFNYIEDVFSTYLYTGTGASQTITNNIDLSTKGGLVWIRRRGSATDHHLENTVSGATKYLISNTTNAEQTNANAITAFNSTGFSLGSYADVNSNTGSFVSWTFRKQPKFFDVQTFTQNGGVTVNHNLGSVPACIIIKSTAVANSWYVYHTSLNTPNGNGPRYNYLNLNSTAASTNASGIWINNITSTSFDITNQVIAPYTDYVAYIFASNAGGFGLTSADNVISCGSYTGNGATTGPTITLGYEPQFVMVKNTSNTGNWVMLDNMRGMPDPAVSNDALIYANTSGAETSNNWMGITATGFYPYGANFNVNASADNYIYIAIRRGPMKVPTDATKVFKPVTYTGSAGNQSITGVGFPPDLFMANWRASVKGNFEDRLRGTDPYLQSTGTGAEATGSTNIVSYDMSGITLGVNNLNNKDGASFVGYFYQRAPSFFDEVCYTGTGSATTFNHNLGIAPGLIIVKKRSAISTTGWLVGATTTGYANKLYLNLTDASAADSTAWNSTAPTSTVFSVGTNTDSNASAATFVAYLFATCAGVSKVGSYTGNGTTQTIDCGFGAGGARFVLIKRTDAVGDWYVYDTARGMTTLTDPYLLINSTAAEVATLGSVTTVSTGFALNSTILAAINVSAGTYIFLAIA
jgi:hypothetical protein